MNNNYFDQTDTLATITDKYPETVPLFVSHGFRQMGDEAKRKTFGKSITLAVALSLKKLNALAFEELLVQRIEQHRGGIAGGPATAAPQGAEQEIKVQGLLPCPVRLPLVEKLDSFLERHHNGGGAAVTCDLKAASVGLDWLKDGLPSQDDPSSLADIFISAGFDLFFDERLMGKFKKNDVFIDGTGFERLNPIFDNPGINLKDPAGHYSMLAVVPAVFLVNLDELNGRQVPRTWADILAPEFEKSVSLPIGDFDLFNAILLNLHKIYGPESLVKLGKSLLEGMHPAQMVKSHIKKSRKPAVTIMPYFFTKMVREGSGMEAVWPEDGSIVSPIFMLTKKDRLHHLQPMIDFFASLEIAEILSHKGLFPSIHPHIDNRIAADRKFMWLGWDYIYQNDIAALIGTCEELFNSSIK